MSQISKTLLQLVSLNAQNVQNLGGRISGNAIALAARGDLNNIGGQINAANALTAVAGRDLNVTSTTSSATNNVGNNTFSLTGFDRIAGLYVSNPGGTLLASAGRDVNLTTAMLQSQGSIGITAGNNINLATVNTASANAVVFDRDNFAKDSQSQDIGSQLSAANKLALEAGNDFNAKAATLSAGTTLSATAGNSINLAAGQQTSSSAFGMSSSQSSLFGSTSYAQLKIVMPRRGLASIVVMPTARDDVQVNFVSGMH